jgi:predicted nucleotidyltransferase
MEYSGVTMHPLARIRQNLLVIRERYGVARIGIFGSVARNEETPASDIDVLVEFREGEETFDART